VQWEFLLDLENDFHGDSVLYILPSPSIKKWNVSCHFTFTILEKRLFSATISVQTSWAGHGSSRRVDLDKFCLTADLSNLD
jgi:hypothetical protein